MTSSYMPRSLRKHLAFFKHRSRSSCVFMAVPALALLGTGCNPSSPSAPDSTIPRAVGSSSAARPSTVSTASADAITLDVGIDATLSDRPHLGHYALLGAKLAARLNKQSDRVTFSRVDWDCEEFLNHTATGSSDALLAVIARELKPFPAKDGARSGLFWQRVAQRAETEGGDVVVVYFGDASDENPDPAAWRTLRAAGKSLADNPRVKKVIFCGAERSNRARIQRDFPLGHDRLVILGPSEATLRVLLEQINAVRH